MRTRNDHIEREPERWNGWFTIPHTKIAVAWHCLGWETAPDEDTEWSGYETRTGKVICVMVGDDRYHRFDPEDLQPLPREKFCGVCGQIGCCHDGLDRD